jgi:hypothetical protein
LKADLDRLLHAALEKETDGLPYAIYLDANLPPTNVGAAGRLSWVPDVERMLDRREASAANPDPFVGITVTNFSWHYAGDTAITGPSESVLVLPKFPRVPLRDERTMRLIFEAAQQYGHVPGMFPED